MCMVCEHFCQSSNTVLSRSTVYAEVQAQVEIMYIAFPWRLGSAVSSCTTTMAAWLPRFSEAPFSRTGFEVGSLSLP